MLPVRGDVDPCRATLLYLDAIEWFPSLDHAITCVSGNKYLDKDLAEKDITISRKMDWRARMENFTHVFFDNDVSAACDFLRDYRRCIT